jgi:hypothetical protein
MADDNATLTADPPDTAAAGTSEATAMQDLARVMTKAGIYGGQHDDATLPVDGKGGLAEVPQLESETVPDKTKDDSADKTKPDPKAKPEPAVLTARQKQGAKLAEATDEEIANADDTTLAMWDKWAATEARIMGKIGAAKQKAMKALGAEDTQEADKGGESQDETAAEEGKEPPTKPVSIADYVAKAPSDLAELRDEYGDVNPDSLVATLQSEREERSVLQASLQELTEQMEQFLVDQFIGTLDPGAFAHLGTGPTWRLDKESPEYKARKEMQDFAKNYAIGVAMSSGKPIGLLDALALTTMGAEQIRDSTLKKRSATQSAAQRRAIHEPGRAGKASVDPAAQAMDELRATMGKAGLLKY